MSDINPYLLQLIQQNHVPAGVALRVLSGESLEDIRARTKENKVDRWPGRADHDLRALRKKAGRGKGRRWLVNRFTSESSLDKNTVHRLLFSVLAPGELEREQNMARNMARLIEKMGKPDAQRFQAWARSLMVAHASDDVCEPEQLIAALTDILAQEYAAQAKVVVGRVDSADADAKALRVEVEQHLSATSQSIWGKALHRHAKTRVSRCLDKALTARHTGEAWSERQGMDDAEEGRILTELAGADLEHVQHDREVKSAIRAEVVAGLSDETVARLPEEEIASRVVTAVDHRLDARGVELRRKARDEVKRRRRAAQRQEDDERIEQALTKRYTGHRRIDPQHFKRCLRKADIAAFLGMGEAESRRQRLWPLLEKLCETIESDETALKRLCRDYQAALALSAIDLERRLSITRTERQRWTEDQRLAVAYRESVRKYGRTLSVPWYDYEAAASLTPQVLEQWRGQRRQEVARNRKAGAVKAQRRAADNAARRDAARAFIAERRRAWVAHGGLYGAATLEAALWTLWASRLAKRNQLKARRARKHSATYKARAAAWYEAKNRAMADLARTPHARLSRYIPDNSHRYSVTLCEDHLSLYYLEVSVSGIDDHFGFHVPYEIGAAFLPDFNTLPKVVDHEEGWGEFRFGREISDDESVLFPEKAVGKSLEATLKKLEMFAAEASMVPMN